MLAPGAGHIYARAWRFGAIALATSWSLDALLLEATRTTAPTPNAAAILFSGAALVLLTYMWLAFDAARRKSNRPFPDPEKWFKSAWLAAIIASIVPGVLAWTIPAGWRPFAIPSTSMMPTLAVGDRIYVDTRTASMTLTRGDVIVFTHDGQFYVKRLIGLAGDDVSLARGIVTINGVELVQRPGVTEPTGETANEAGLLVRRFVETLPGGRTYTVQRLTAEGDGNNTSHYQVPPGTIFFLGDNRDNSLDSRMSDFGFIPLRNVVGRAGTIYWARDTRRLLSRID